jgi:hypothetical protein
MPNFEGSITLGDVEAKTDVLAVACSRCERAGRYLVAMLIGRHGRSFPIPTLLHTLSADCPKHTSVNAYDACGAQCPELPALFMQQVQSD